MAFKRSRSIRQPETRVFIDGTRVSGALDTRVTLCSNYKGGQFSFSAVVAKNRGALPYWAESSNAVVEITARTHETDGWTTLIEGRPDAMSLDAVAGIIHVSGRDYTSVLIDSNSQEVFVNKTSSEIVGLIAERHGLQMQGTPTSDLVGRWDSDGHTYATLAQFSASITEWDIVVDLAQNEAYDAYVDGRTVYFVPLDRARRLFELTTSDLTSLRLEKTFSVTADLEIVVQSWDSARQIMTESKAVGRVGSIANGSGPRSSKRYIITKPNLSMALADGLASHRLNELSASQMTAELEMPGELTLAPRDELIFTDIVGGYRDPFRIDMISRRFSSYAGFSQRIIARSVPRVPAL